jgi:antitoxin component of RelBE/YafQ-DinJ toxin-antitoxin module
LLVKTTAPTNPLPIRVCFGELHNESYIRIEEVLKKSKSLKDSQKYKKVFINRDLTVTQIIRLKQLIKTRNEENLKLDAKHKEAKTAATYRYGIRNDMVVKVFLGKI